MVGTEQGKIVGDVHAQQLQFALLPVVAGKRDVKRFRLEDDLADDVVIGGELAAVADYETGPDAGFFPGFTVEHAYLENAILVELVNLLGIERAGQVDESRRQENPGC